MKNRMDSRGVTLVEVTISLLVLLIVFAGLMQASLLAIDTNLRNEVRDEAVRIAAGYMNLERSAAWSGLAPTVPDCTADPSVKPWPNLGVVDLNYRNTIRAGFFVVSRCISELDDYSRQVGIQVSWTDMKTGEHLSHTIFSNLRNK